MNGDFNIIGTVRHEDERGWRAIVTLARPGRALHGEARSVRDPGEAIGLAAARAWDSRQNPPAELER